MKILWDPIYYKTSADTVSTKNRFSSILLAEEITVIWEKHVRFNINPLGPHDALKHHFTSLKTDLIFLQPRGLE